MSYEVEVRPIPRSRRPLLVPPLIAVAVVAAALIAGPTPVVSPLPAAEPAPTSQPLDESRIACRQLRDAPCRDIVRAAQLVLWTDHPPIYSATAWRSLSCGDDSDCPHTFLDRARPAGSVVFVFADRSRVSVNVVWRDVSSRRFEDGTELLDARIARWSPASG